MMGIGVVGVVGQAVRPLLVADVGDQSVPQEGEGWARKLTTCHFLLSALHLL